MLCVVFLIPLVAGSQFRAGDLHLGLRSGGIKKVVGLDIPVLGEKVKGKLSVLPFKKDEGFTLVGLVFLEFHRNNAASLVGEGQLHQVVLEGIEFLFSGNQRSEGSQLVDLLAQGLFSLQRIGDELLAGGKQLLRFLGFQLPRGLHLLNGVLPLFHLFNLLLRRLVDDGKDNKDHKDQDDPDN